MPVTSSGATERVHDLERRVHAALSARLMRDAGHPVALALSGGGDSMALLLIAADWARAHGRPLLALTVDHRLNPESDRWSNIAEQAARRVRADWRGLVWAGPKPSTGLPAAARAARHGLIAAAARASGARVVLFAHTADDVAEGDLMRAEGSTLGHVRPWAPSPAWPEGRGLMLSRPMLGERRAALRDWLAERGADWIDDPSNDDMRYARSRARASLLPMREGGARTPPLREARNAAAVARAGFLPVGEGVLKLDRATDASTLAAALVCAGGGDRPPRGGRLAAVLVRLRSGEDFTGVLCGTRIEAAGDRVLLAREAGEFARRPRPSLPLTPGLEAVWDGRWAVTVNAPGWSVAPAAGRMAALSPADRAWLKALPAAARGGYPVLIRNDPHATVLAGAVAQARSLVEQRLALALGGMTHEREL